MLCDNRSTFEPFEDQGIVQIRPAYAELLHLLDGWGGTVRNTREGCAVSYQGRDELVSLIRLLRGLPNGSREEISFRIMDGATPQQHHPWTMAEQLGPENDQCDMLNIILDQQFTSHMQPIVDRCEQIVAYEFLLRPAKNGRPFPPQRLFDTARRAGLHYFLDREARNAAIEASAKWLPSGVKRFINFLPSSISDPKKSLVQTFRVLESHHLDPCDFVFEVVETERIDDIQHLQAIFDTYRKHGISLAMDDVGAGYSTLEQMVLLKPDYVKIDRSLIDHCEQNSVKQQQLQMITRTAHEFGAKVLAEGIERREEFQYCRQIGIELAQGYLFGKPAERPLKGPQSQLMLC
ncbi:MULTISPECIES: EAL domain-containing protein [Paenibacillus]|uniref:EAL domain-containing protein n=1 Tax=Paenibacillus campinasensis TaxID=66347 RepID=A0A268EDY8_9BACL|nr:EAL domain-containing protein [Paenibacillus campinasensis]PAD71310.1 hypothetical protein CHH67_24805 [Paenibacillus campinasensis]